MDNETDNQALATIDAPSELSSVIERTASPKIGLHPRIPAPIYHGWDACNNSSLNTLKNRSPLHCRYEREHPKAQTPEMMIGSALHTLVLEPSLFHEQYVIAGECSAVLKTGERKGEHCGAEGKHYADGSWFCGKHASEGLPLGQIITSDQACDLEAMRDAIFGDPVCHSALNTAVEREISALWEEKETGLLCKCRFDALGKNAGIAVDIKTTTNASEEAFTRAIYDYGYHRQAAHYVAGAAALGIQIEDYIIIAVEKEAPYAVSFNRLTDEAIEAGAKELRPLIERYHHCQLTNTWPGYSMRDIGIPAWKQRTIDAV